MSHCAQGFTLKALRHLVLDEADRLLNMDFEQEIDQILKVIPRERRTQLFSATMTTKVAKLQRACLQNPVKVEVDAKYRTVDTLRQQYLFIPAKHKVRPHVTDRGYLNQQQPLFGNSSHGFPYCGMSGTGVLCMHLSCASVVLLRPSIKDRCASNPS